MNIGIHARVFSLLVGALFGFLLSPEVKTQTLEVSWSWLTPGNASLTLERVASNESKAFAITSDDQVVVFNVDGSGQEQYLQMPTFVDLTDVAVFSGAWLCSRNGAMYHIPWPYDSVVQVDHEFSGILGPMAVKNGLALIVSSDRAAYIKSDILSDEEWTKRQLPLYNAIVGAEVSQGGLMVLIDRTDSVYVSRDTGATWTRHDLGVVDKLTSVTISPDDVIYIGTESRGILRSDNFGQTWSYPVMPFILPVTAIQTHSTSRIIAACGSGGLILSSQDSGRTFIQTDSIGVPVNDLSSAEWAYVSVGGDGLMFSLDSNGLRLLNQRATDPIVSITFIERNDGGSSIGYAVSRSGVVLHRPTGSRFFTRIESAPLVPFNGRVSSFDGETLFLSNRTGPGTSYVSRDSGRTWTPTYYVHLGQYYREVDEITVVSQRCAYALNSNVLTKTLDKGETWQLLGLSPMLLSQKFAVKAFVSEDVVWGANANHDPNTLYVSYDGCLTWQSINVGGNGGAPHTLAAFDKDNLLTITEAFIAITTDGGRTWQKSPGARQRDSYVDVSRTGQWIRWDGQYNGYVYQKETGSWSKFTQPYKREAVNGEPSAIAWDGTDRFAVPFGNGGILEGRFEPTVSVNEPSHPKSSVGSVVSISGCLHGSLNVIQETDGLRHVDLYDLTGSIIGEVQIHLGNSAAVVSDCHQLPSGVYLIKSSFLSGTVHILK
jgi:photosystem II stability/assembly factor-like uncharacterized protein